MISHTELRSGNQLHYLSAEGETLLAKIDWQDLKWLEEDSKGFNAVHNPIILTEDIMIKIRCRYREENSRVEFSVSEPGERQVEKNYWSNEVVEDRRLHMSPAYRDTFIEGKPVRNSIPSFWFIWICAYGTGSNWFLSIRDIHRNPLIYFHDLQNLYFSLSGKELF